MDKDVKKIRLTSPVWEYQRVADICNEQSKNGYQLEKLKVLGKSTFRKDTSKRYIYVIDFNMIILNKNEKDSYVEMFKEQGWEFVGNTFNGFSMFRKEYKDNISEEEYKIYTDEESSKELYCRLAGLIKTVLIMFAISILCMFVGLLIFLISSDGEDVVIIAFFGIFIACCLPVILFLNYGLKKLKI